MANENKIPKTNTKHSDSLEERLLKSKGLSESGCWIWLGTTLNNGYGQMTWGGRQYLVHRASAIVWLELDSNDSNTQVCHKDEICNRKDCFNPDHLYIGSASTNMIDLSNKTTHCPNGHPYSGKNLGWSTNKNGTHKRCRECNKLSSRKRRSRGIGE